MSYKYADLTTLQELVTKTKALLTDYYLKTETYSQTEVNNLIAGITTITYEIVQTLPTASATTYFNDSKKVYMLRNSASTGTDFYEEYITLRSGSAGSYTYSWELIGTTQIDLSGYVPTSRKVNNKALTADITLTASDVGAVPTTRTVNSKALSSDITLTASDVSAVPTTRTVNSKALSSDITLSASDVGAVPTTRTVNSKALSADITLSASDVGAEPTISTKGSAFNRDFEDTDANIQMNGTGDAGTSNKVARADHTHPSDTTRVPTTRKVNNKALSSDITLSASDVGAMARQQASGSENSVRITSLENGITELYHVKYIYYNGNAGTEKLTIMSTTNENTYIYVTKNSNGWYWFYVANNPTNNSIVSIVGGFTTTTAGTYFVKDLADIITGTTTSTVTQDSTALLTSGGAYTALQGKANTTDLPTKTSDIINDGSDGTSTYVEDDELVAITTAEVDALF